MDPKEFKDWTPEELLAELRRRELTGTAAPGGERSRGAAPASPGHRRELRTLATPELSKLVQDRQRVVYGVDNRKDLYQVSKASVKKAAASVVALVEADDLVADGAGFKLRTEPYQESFNLCGNEPFVNQPTGCFCSGFLVAPNVIATAGHCVKSQADLGHIRFVFGFRMKDATTAQTTFSADDVYSGAQLLGRKLSDDGTDWALVRLDRAAVGRTPLPFRASGKVKAKQSLFVIGHPCGLPQKYAPGAKVRDNSASPFFVANLDTYGGNSGSAVFNAQTSVVEGILVRGENDFVTNGTCNVSLVCPTSGCRGEDVTRATVWSKGVPKSGRSSRGKGSSHAASRKAR